MTEEAAYKKRILLFGDSNTRGYNCESPDSDRYEDSILWTSVLARSLGDGYTVIPEGDNGRTTSLFDPMGYSNGMDDLIPTMREHAPIDLIAILLGTNDAKEDFHRTVFDIAYDAAKLAEIAMNSPYGRDGGHPRVLLVSPIRIEEHPDVPIFGRRAAMISREFAPHFRRHAKRLRCDYMDAALYANPSPADGVHLGSADQRNMARAFTEKIRDLFSD